VFELKKKKKALGIRMDIGGPVFRRGRWWPVFGPKWIPKWRR